MNDLEKILQAVDSYPSNYQPDVEAGVQRFKQRIRAEQSPKLRVASRRILAIAASVSLIIVALFGWQKYAYLGSDVIITAANQKETITLPDGTIVTLNENSKLSYDWAKRFAENRMIELSGEAYFEVRKQMNRPFEITTPNSKVKVLGTAFNLKDYPVDGKSIVKVTEGEVAFKGNNSKKELVLVEEERGIYNSNATSEKQVLVKKEASNLNANSWIVEELKFRSTSIETVFDDLEDHYNIEIRVENTTLLNCKHTGSFKDKSIEEVLKSLTTSYHLIFEKLDENSYQLMEGNCK